jgi:phospholipid transport system substrate-binding protein
MRHLQTALAAFMLVAIIQTPTFADREGPDQVVEHYQDVLLSVMKNARVLGFKGRFETLKPVIFESFNLPFMAHVTVGRHWDKMSEEQRQRFVEAFSNFSVANFANRFDDYSGERFEKIKDMETSRKDILVFTELVKPDGDQVKINYLLRPDGDQWRIIDVYLDSSISELATRRSEYTSVVRKTGIDGLIAAIENKIKELATD